MAYKKEFSTNCKMCGVEWNDDFSNKKPLRAVCLECYKKEYEERKEKYKSIEYKKGENRHDKYRPFKIENRKHIYKELNLKLKGLKKREEVREFLKNRFDELLEDKALWDYINDTDIENKYK